MTDSKGLFPLPQYRKPVKKMSNGRRAIIKELDALQKTVNSNTLLIETLQRNMAATEEISIICILPRCLISSAMI